MSGLKLAFRTLTKTPFVTGVAILSLALGIGANAAIFSLLDQMLLRSLPVPEPERLVNLEAPGPKPGSQSCGTAGGCEVVFSYPMFRDLEERQESFTGIAAHVAFGANLAYDGQTENGAGTMVSGSYFPVLELQPALGRLFSPADDQNIGGHFVVVLSHDYWQNRLGGDPDVLNSTLVVNGQSMLVVGVTPAGFQGTTLGSTPDIFVPITMRELMQPGWEGYERRNSYWMYAFARLRPGVSLEQGRAELSTIYRGIVTEVELPETQGLSDEAMERFATKDIIVEAGERGQSVVHSEARVPLIMLISITGVVLLIACANIANLLLVRGAGRGPEMAIRASLGGSRAQLFKQLLTESVLLAVLGGIASLFVASWTLGFIGQILPPESFRMVSLELSTPVVLFAGGLALGTGFLFGFYPAIHGTRTDLVSVLKANSGQPAAAKSAVRFRSVLVTTQIALSMALLVAAGLFLKSLVNVNRVDLGLDPSNMVVFTVSPQLNGYSFEEARSFFERMEEELAAIPGVTGVSLARIPVLSGNNWGTDVSVEGFHWEPGVDANARLNMVGAGYFSLMGIPLMAGREFTQADAGGEDASVAVINEAFAEKFELDPREAVGKMMSDGGGNASELTMQIVGVIQNAKYAEVKQEIQPMFFTPYRQEQGVGAMTFYLRTGMEPAPVIRSVPEVVKGLDTNLPVEDLKTLEAQARENIFLDRMISTLAAAFATLATLLAAVGLYGVLAYSVAQRTREIGLRMALGAAAPKVRAMVLRQMGTMVVLGSVFGVIGALAVGRSAQALLFEMQWHDPVVVILSVILLSGVAMAAGYIPAYRASKVEPMKALRQN